MPVDPRVPYDLWLDCFEGTPDGERPAFTFRRLNGAEFNTLSKALYEQTPPDTDALSASVFEAFSIGLTGWRNQIDPATGESIAFDPAHIERVINTQEAVQLLEKRITRGRVNGTNLKN